MRHLKCLRFGRDVHRMFEVIMLTSYSELARLASTS